MMVGATVLATPLLAIDGVKLSGPRRRRSRLRHGRSSRQPAVPAGDRRRSTASARFVRRTAARPSSKQITALAALLVHRPAHSPLEAAAMAAVMAAAAAPAEQRQPPPRRSSTCRRRDPPAYRPRRRTMTPAAGSAAKDQVAEIKGTRTEQNLLKAFAGESQARMRYTYYAEQALGENYPQIAEIFMETGDNELERHAHVLRLPDRRHLRDHGVLPRRRLRLDGGEPRGSRRRRERRTDRTLPRIRRDRRRGGLQGRRQGFKLIAKVEKEHEARYRKLLANTFTTSVDSRVLVPSLTERSWMTQQQRDIKRKLAVLQLRRGVRQRRARRRGASGSHGSATTTGSAPTRSAARQASSTRSPAR